MEQLTTGSDDTPDWQRLRCVLDEAMSELSEADYDALALRYYGDRDFRTVGQALGVTDDTAQKRVTRALEKLREILIRYRIQSTSAALSTILAVNAVQAAPPMLAAAISSAALTGATGVAMAMTTAQTIAMTTFQKTLIGATLAILTGGGLYEARQTAQLRAKNQALQQEQSIQTEQVQQLQQQLEATKNQLAERTIKKSDVNAGSATRELLQLRGEVTRLHSDAQDPGGMAAKDLVVRIETLKRRLAQAPEARIPELEFLEEKDWINAAQGQLETEADFRRAFATLRNGAENKFVHVLQSALKDYLRGSTGVFPTALSQLQPYFAAPVDENVLQRWNIVSAQSIPGANVGSDWAITQNGPVDDVFDSRIAVGATGYISTDFASSETKTAIANLMEAYAKANNGSEPKNPTELLSFATTPGQQSAIQKLILRMSGGK